MKLFSTLALLTALTFTTPAYAEVTAEERCLNISSVLLKIGTFRDSGIAPEIVFQGLVFNGLAPEVSVQMIDLVYLTNPNVPPAVIAKGTYDRCLRALTTY